MSTEKRIFWGNILFIVLIVLLAGCGGGGGGGDDSTPTPDPWNPDDPDPKYSQVEATADYFGVDTGRQLIYYTKIVYEEEEPAYSWGYLTFTAIDSALYQLGDDLSLFLDNITNTTYRYVKVDSGNYYLLEESSQSSGALALSDSAAFGFESDVWGSCTGVEEVTIPKYTGSDSMGTYPGCLVFEESATDGDDNQLTVKVWFSPNIGIVKKEEVITGSAGYVSGSRTWYLYGGASVTSQSTIKKASLRLRGNSDVIDKYNALLSKNWQKSE